MLDDVVDDTSNQYCNYEDFADLCNLSTSCKFSVIHFNIRSFSSNADELYAFLDKLNVRPGTIVLTETWFSPTYSVDIEGYFAYHVYREDRRGGGVSIYVRSDYNSKLLPHLTQVSDVIEVCSVEVNAGRSRVVIHGVYRPPENSVSLFTDELVNVIGDVRRSTHTFVIGDTNVDLVSPSPLGYEFIDMFRSSSFIPLISVPTRVTQDHASCLDHVWFNQLCDVNAGVFKVNITDHYPIFVVLPILSKRDDTFIKYFRDHSFASLAKLHDEIHRFCNDCELSQFIGDTDVNLAVQIFEEKLYFLYNKCCPIRSKRISYNRFSKPWITNQLMESITRKHYLFRQYKQGNVSFDEYNNFKNHVTCNLRKAKADYFKVKFRNSFGNAKSAWSLIDSLIGKRRKRVVPDRIVSGSDEVTDPTEIANSFNEYFANVAIDLESKIPHTNTSPLDYMGDRTQTSFFVAPVSHNDVNSIIAQLKNKSTGLQSVPIFVFKTFTDLLSPLIANLFNLSVSNGIFPSCLKVARVTPVFKRGDRTSVCNYRPICSLPILSKIFEKLMCRQLMGFLKMNDTLYRGQYGFRKNLTTSDAILEFLNVTITSLDSKLSSIAVFLDFAKAFDTVSHRILIAKLEHYGIRGIVLEWFRSYICCRSQFVRVADSESDITEVEKGVPQGSVLGPILFLIYINDMRLCSAELGFVHYADDTTVFCSGRRVEDLVPRINSELLKLCEWLRCNRLSLNTDKTTFMHFTDMKHPFEPVISIDEVVIGETDRASFLGIAVDNRLNFRHHVRNMCTSISRSIGLLNRISNIVPPIVKKNMYYSYVYAKVSYGILAWGRCSMDSVNHVERLLSRARKIVDYPLTGPNRITIDLMDFDSMYRYFSAINMFRIVRLDYHPYFLNLVKDLIPQHDRGTRFCRSDSFNIPRYNKSKSQRHFLFQSVHIWNNLSDEVKACQSLNSFKKLLKYTLIAEQNQ